MRMFLSLVCVAGLLLTVAATGSAQYAGEAFFSVTGKATDDAGNPLSDLQIHAFIRRDVGVGPGQAGLANAHMTQRTDDLGSFTLQILDGAQAAVFATKPGSVMDYRIIDSPSDSVDLQLKSNGRSITGTVKDAQGNALPKALIAIAANSREVFTGAHSGGPWRLGLKGAGALNLEANEEGQFTVNHLPALPIILWAVPAGDNQSLKQLVHLSAKKPVVDLTQGDQLNYSLIVDPPVQLPASIQRHNQAIENQIRSHSAGNQP